MRTGLCVCPVRPRVTSYINLSLHHCPQMFYGQSVNL
jgi:hypothetical protein